MEHSMKKTLSWETREQLKERLALLKKEYAKTVHKLQRAQKAERVRNHVKSTITHQNQLLEEQSITQFETGEASSFLDTNQSSSSHQRSQAPVEESKERKSAVTFNLEPEIIEVINSPNVALTSTFEFAEQPSAEPFPSPVVETIPITNINSQVHSRLKLKKKRSCEVLRKEAASEQNESLAADGKSCDKEIEELNSPVNKESVRSSIFNRGKNVSKSVCGGVKENVEHRIFLGSPEGEEHFELLKNGVQEVKGNCLTLPVSRTMNGSVYCSSGDKSTVVSTCENKAFRPRDLKVLTEDAQQQQAKQNCSEDLTEALESNLANESVMLDSDCLQASTAVAEVSEETSLNSCTLVEGLLFPVEYYVRTTRRMTSCQRQVDLDAVIHSHLGKCRNGGKGRYKKSTHEQSNPVKGFPKAEGELNNTLLLFNSQEDGIAGSDAASSQQDSIYPLNIDIDSQDIKSNPEKRRNSSREESIKSKLTDTEVFKDEFVAWTLNKPRIPDVQCAMSSKVQSKKESKEKASSSCQPVSDANELCGSAANKLDGRVFSNITDFTMKSASLSQNDSDHNVDSLQNSESQTSDILVGPFKEDSIDPSSEDTVLTLSEHHLNLNSDTDSQELIPETQQDLFFSTARKKSFRGTRQSFPLGIDSKTEESLCQVSQPKRRVRLSKGNSYRKTRASSRKFNTGLDEGTLTCSEPLLPVKKPIIKKLFHSLEVQDFDLPDEEYGQLKEKLRAETLKKSSHPLQYNMVNGAVGTQVKTENWDMGKCDSPRSQDISQAVEKLEEHLLQKNFDCKELNRTPEKPALNDVVCPYGQKTPKPTPNHKLSSSVLLSTPSCTPQSGRVHQCEQGAISPVFPSLGFTPAFSSPSLSQISCGNQNSSQIGTLPHTCKDVKNNSNCDEDLQTSGEGEVPLTNGKGTPSAREYLEKEEQPAECCHVNQSEMVNEDNAVEFIEEENNDALTPPLGNQLQQKPERQTLHLISKIQNPSTSCIIDLCTVFWMVKEAKTLCIACACETAVFLWAPQQLNQWTNIHMWVFDKVPIIELIPIPDAVNILCVAFGNLEIREVKVLHSVERNCLEHTLLQTGDINALLGLPGRRLVCSCGTLQSQYIELNILSKEGRRERCMQLVPPNEMVLAFSEVKGEAEALIGSTIMSNIVIWNLKTGHLLKKIHLSESYPGTVCQKAYSESGILFVLFSHRYVGNCDGSGGNRVCALRMVGVNPMNGKSRPVMSYMLPLECHGRYLVGGVKDQSIAAIVTPGTLILWDVLSGHIATILHHGPNAYWSLFHWAEANSCLLARKNDQTVYIYKYVGTGMDEV
ncbi:partner and localizer of BRCA2 isoform X1 [Chiloscyllium plagiosum]|uniref:partner and localizer of BRCA2 isoform X1 n=1 Tax=Chiloscyllium plagiosum TaxID=36176 RepID=UPI001CB87D34|nr:partner and localizer of BRCA2 isoform X1 [Chiloscyllium plagiosum]